MIMSYVTLSLSCFPFFLTFSKYSALNAEEGLRLLSHIFDPHIFPFHWNSPERTYTSASSKWHFPYSFWALCAFDLARRPLLSCSFSGQKKALPGLPLPRLPRRRWILWRILFCMHCMMWIGMGVLLVPNIGTLGEKMLTEISSKIIELITLLSLEKIKHLIYIY